MFEFLLKRLAQIVPTLIFVSMLIFGLQQLLPGDPAKILAGEEQDPTVIAYLLDPTLFTGRHVNVEIETESALTMGTTVVDWWGARGAEPNAHWVTEVDADGYFALIGERIAALDAVSGD